MSTEIPSSLYSYLVLSDGIASAITKMIIIQNVSVGSMKIKPIIEAEF